MSKISSVSRAEATAQALSEQMGLALVDVELVKEPTGRFLRFYIDRDGGVTLDDCERFHKAIQPMMEDVDYDYMEVSSPGADRPFRRPEEFERAIGTRVEVKLYRAIDGSKRHTGTLTHYGADGLTLELDGTPARAIVLERKLVAQVAPVVEYDEAALERVLNETNAGGASGSEEPRI